MGLAAGALRTPSAPAPPRTAAPPAEELGLRGAPPSADIGRRGAAAPLSALGARAACAADISVDRGSLSVGTTGWLRCSRGTRKMTLHRAVGRHSRAAGRRLLRSRGTRLTRQAALSALLPGCSARGGAACICVRRTLRRTAAQLTLKYKFVSVLFKVGSVIFVHVISLSLRDHMTNDATT